MMETLAPIGLEELTARAALLTRVDRKYVVPVAGLPSLLGALPDGVRVLEIDGRREFGYRSSYLDTEGLDCYLASARRRRRRFKVRLRSYLDTGAHFLEIKTRGPRGTTVKRRVAHPGPGVPLQAEALAFARSLLGQDIGGFELTLTTTYRRATLFFPRHGSRVTVDTGLTWILPGGPILHTADYAVIETKSVRGTHDADRVLWSHKHRPTSISKYCTGLAALRPELPSHRWQPVLRRHFPPSTESR